MPFSYQNDHLFADGVPLRDIAEAVGTPAYIYSAVTLRQQVATLQSAFANFDATLHYSLKANANLALIRLLHSLGLGMDAVSGGEIFRATQAGVPGEQIVFAGVGKTSEEIRYALEVGVGWFNVESQAELALLNQLAGSAKPNVALRLNPDVQAATHHHIATGHGGAKFGMSAAVIKDILAHRDDYPNLNIQGLHVHIGSQLGNVDATVQAVKRAQAIAGDLRTLNIGGGFPVPYLADTDYPSPQDFADTLRPLLDDWHIKLEPGRYITAPAGVMVVKVLYVKQQDGQTFVITDGSMSELIRPALYEAIHPIQPLHKHDAANALQIITGPVCESADVLHRGAELPRIQTGDYLAVMMAGAYGFVMASNYNQRPRPPEILVENNTFRTIRRREGWQDLIQHEDGLQ